MILNCIAIDDEPLALEKIVDYSNRIPYLKLLKHFSKAAEALVYLKKQTVDLIFLDIQLEDVNAFEFMDCIKKDSKIILTTAFDKYALQAFDYSVTDYLLKPFSFSRFLKSTEKVYTSLFTKDNIEKSESQQSKSKNYIFVKSGFSTVKVEFDNILYIEGMKDYLAIQTQNSKILTLLSFNKISEALPDKEFVRIHRSFIVTLDRIERIENNHVKICDKKIPIGKNFKKGFYDKIDEIKLN